MNALLARLHGAVVNGLSEVHGRVAHAGADRHAVAAAAAMVHPSTPQATDRLTNAPRRRFTQHALLLGGLGATPWLSGCAGPSLKDYAGHTPALDFRRYFDGRILAHGMVLDRSGRVQRRMQVTMDCQWTGNAGTLDESFLYDDGERQKRVWRLQQDADGQYSGTAADVVGVAHGASSGPAFNWRYTLKVPVKDRVWELDFDDWMFLIDERTMLNKAVMSKFGVRVGEVLLSFTKT